MIENGKYTNTLVMAINKVNLPTTFLEKHGLKWEGVPCKAGEVRVTQPHLAHGAFKSKRGDLPRATAVPWYTGVDSDPTNLEIREGRTWESISAANRDMLAPEKTPSGYANMYGKIPYAFPAAFLITCLGAISNAIVGRIKYDDGGGLGGLQYDSSGQQSGGSARTAHQGVQYSGGSTRRQLFTGGRLDNDKDMEMEERGLRHE